jgi:putative hemolysin
MADYILFLSIVIFFLLLVLALLSILDAALHRLSRVDLLVLYEQDRHRGDPMLQQLSEEPLEVQLHLKVGTQFLIVVIAILTTYVFLQEGGRYGLIISFLATAFMVLLFRQILPNLMAQGSPVRSLVQLLPVLKAFYKLTRPLAFPVLSSMRLAEKSESGVPQQPAEQASEEEIQAYLDVGEEDGILEESDSEMIQSVVEFGDTLVKQVMTPRTEIARLPVESTVRQLQEAVVREKHSRIPVYKDQVDNIIGIVYVRHVLGYLEEGKYHTPISQFVLPVLFIPETKKVRELLKELQASRANMAIVVDEFGGVSGLVTVEDLLEEIVGEIRDEDEPREEDIRREDSGSYWVSGEASLERLEEVFGLRVEVEDCTTASGLIIQRLGRVPARNELLRLEHFQVEILNTDGRRIMDLRFIPDPVDLQVHPVGHPRLGKHE